MRQGVREQVHFKRLVLMAALAYALPASAAVSPQDAQVALRSMMYLTEKPEGAVSIAVIYAKSLPKTEQDAKALADALAGLSLPGMSKPEPRLVAVEDLGALRDARMAFLTEGLSGHYDKVFEATKGKKILTVSIEKACVQSGRCVMAVQSQPKVEILVSRAAAAAAGVSFVPTFRMLISEL